MAKRKAVAGGRAAKILQHLVGDAVATCVWVACSSVIAEIAEWASEQTGFKVLHLNVAGTALGLALLAPLCGLLFNAMINPVNCLALVVSGRGGVLVNTARMAGQLGGALAGSWIARSVVPEHLTSKFHLLSGKLQDNVTLELGFAAEAALVFFMILVFLYLTDASSNAKIKNGTAVALAPHLTTIVVCLVGAEFTGPSLNPYLAFTWNSHYKQHSSFYEHVMVFWLGPAIGAVAAALLWRLLMPAGGAPAKRRSSKSKAASSKAKTPEAKKQK